MCFNKWGGCPSEINLKMQRKMSVLGLFFRFFSALRLDFELFFLRIFLLVWHLWQQKINIAVGMRARTRVREKEKHNDAVFCHLHYAKRWCRKIFCHFFLDFSLLGAISPPIFRDAIKLCAPNLQFHFHGESQSKILNPNRSLDRYSVAHYGEDNFLSSFIFSLASCCSFVLDVARYGFGLTNNHRLNNPLKSIRDQMPELG